MQVFSYVRFSTPEQSMGGSECRQLEAARAWAKRKGHKLDESLTPDRGLSGFHGAHRKRGSLGRFLAKVKAGEIPRGSILLVEKVSRLGREGAFKTLKTTIFALLEAGITLQCLSPELAFDQEAVEGPLMHVLIALLQTAYQESKDKADYARADWEQRRQRAAEKPLNGVGPAWLVLVDGKWQVVEEKAAVVRRIFALAIEGYGLHAIAHRLNGEKVPPIARAKEWVYSYIGRTLRNRAVLGELQPHVVNGKRSPVGKPISNYYPPIISEADFYKAAAALDSRKNQKGPRGQYVRNLFTGLLRDARDGCTLVTNSESDKCKTVKLVSSGAQRGHAGSTYLTFPYEAAEDSFLKLVKELKASDILPRDRRGGADEAAELTGRLKELEYRISKTRADMKAHGEFDEGLQLLRELADEKKDVDRQLEKAKAKAAAAGSDALSETQSLVDLLEGAKGDEAKLLDLRTKIKAGIRQLVREMWMLTVPLGRDRVAALQVLFADGECRRELAIYYQAGHAGYGAKRESRWWAESLADMVIVGTLDLRDPGHAKRLEAALLALDLAATAD
jgi:DNA invertase Pin-like site-specific DNA recombinase